ncbi:coiled-coil domain-containing protein 174 [Stomoxys calcitrans]|uniref:coiled-coil domain-containing protein 174 n=1 Tax=Stomoxys calcitrans TaxID=35570 RepID=UPI0027E27D8A|nr:coiled-coil domain-containing protein 174 [Stomoxys calcitrans]
MNDPNKVINVNLSSLLSLKAELLRKQTEAKAKLQQRNSNPPSAHRLGNGTLEDDDTSRSYRKKDKKKRAKELDKDEKRTIYEHEDSLLLEKSQKVLEAKAKFYERMSKSGGNLNSDDNCLVMFNKKKQEESTTEVTANPERTLTDSSNASSSDEDEPADGDWVEYTDCLGRTRKCLKQDLENAKRRDAELAASMPERLDQTKANWMIDTMGTQQSENIGDEDEDDMIGPMPPPSLFGDGLSMMSKHEEQKANWERKEQENLEKTDVHYQDVFFDEARQHGVGYYAFSTDEAERKKQQKELLKAREKTLEEQQRRETLRAQREKIIAERVFAAKNRQRARLGLPPLEKEEEPEETEEKLQETKEERKARKKAEKLERKRLKEEEEKERERQEHIRPWDQEKEGVKGKTTNGEDEAQGEWQYKPEREPMTQEQWNEYKRNERNSEFAPPPDIPLKRTNFRSTHNTAFYNNVPPPNMMGYEEPMPSMFNMYQSSSKKEKTFKRRNYEGPMEELPEKAREGVCIPPPSNLEDFFLPSHSKRPKTTKEVENSIEAGLRFIRDNCDKQMPATKSSWTAKADY